MAGNVKEWCWNESGEGKRYLLGGGFGEPTYMFVDEDAQSPWDRKSNYGFRCVRLRSPYPPAAAARIVPPFRDFSKEKPVSDEVFRAFKGLYAYDKAALNVRVEGTVTARTDAGEDQFRCGLRRRTRRRLPVPAEKRGATVPGGRLLSGRLGHLPGQLGWRGFAFLGLHSQERPGSADPDLQEHLRTAGRTQVRLSRADRLLARPHDRLVEGPRPVHRLSGDSKGRRPREDRLLRV